MKRIGGIFVILTAAAFAQNWADITVTRSPDDVKEIKVSFRYEERDDGYKATECFWHIYENVGTSGLEQVSLETHADGTPLKPITIPGCKGGEHKFSEGVHVIELVLNGYELKYPSLLEQRNVRKKVIVQPRVKFETMR
jgi:hypothetical protein